MKRREWKKRTKEVFSGWKESIREKLPKKKQEVIDAPEDTTSATSATSAATDVDTVTDAEPTEQIEESEEAENSDTADGEEK